MNIFDVIYPKACFGCWKRWDYMCSECKKNLKLHPDICPACHRFSKNWFSHIECNCELDWIIICFKYWKVVKKLVYQLKYNSRYKVADFMWEQSFFHILSHGNFWLWEKQKTAIGYVPAHWTRSLYFRGYNQSKKLAKIVSKNLGFDFVQVAKKTKKTSSQAKLDREKRFFNLKWAFEWKKLDYQNILIVDDITTTCSTLIELAKEIKSVNPKTKVWWVVFARNY